MDKEKTKMKELKEKAELIKSLVKKEEKNIVKFLRDLIKIPSFSCNEKKVVLRIKQEMEKVGFDKVWIDDMGNIIGRIGKDEAGLLFDGHIDTVGVKDKSAWKFDPFVGKVEKGFIYGRGASDNKAATAVQVYAGKILKKIGCAAHKPIYVIGTVQEEDCDGLAMKYALTHSLKNKIECVILGECTNGKIYRGHRGRMEIIIKTFGKSCHASDPSRGDNAIYKMAEIIKDIEKLNTKLKDHDFLGKGTIAVTSIECKTDSFNCVPYECTIYLDRRLTYGETKNSAVKELKQLSSVKKFGKVEVLKYDSPSYTGLKIETDKYFPTWILNPNHRLVKSASEAYNILFNKECVVDKWTFSTNGVTSMGELKIPTIGFGPSEEKFAHTTDDKVSIAQLLESTAFYAMLPYIMK